MLTLKAESRIGRSKTPFHPGNAGSYVCDVKTNASLSIPPWQVILGYIGAQCGRQEAWTTVDLALIRGLVPHDQGSSWGFLCLANARRMVPATNPRSRVPLPPQPAVRIGRRSLSCCWCFTSLNALLCLPRSDQANLGSTIRAIAQMKPTSSRAIATTTLGPGLPAAVSLR